MGWLLFLDDERFPADDGKDYEIARTSAEAVDLVSARGMPDLISFDHDLGGEDTAIVFVTWLTDQVLDGTVSFPDGFSYVVHSQNPIGARNIAGRMDGLLQHVTSNTRSFAG